MTGRRRRKWKWKKKRKKKKETKIRAQFQAASHYPFSIIKPMQGTHIHTHANKHTYIHTHAEGQEGRVAKWAGRNAPEACVAIMKTGRHNFLLPG